MRVLINETGLVKQLPVLLEFYGNTDITKQFIRKAGGFGIDQKDIADSIVDIGCLNDDTYKDVDADYVTSASNFDWWQRVINTTMQGDKLIYEHYDMLLSNEIRRELYDAFDYADVDASATTSLNIIKRALSDISVKQAGDGLLITHYEIFGRKTKLTATGDFVFTYEGEYCGTFSAAVDGEYDISTDSEDKQIWLSDGLDCSVNLTSKQDSKVKAFLKGRIEFELNSKGFCISSSKV